MKNLSAVSLFQLTLVGTTATSFVCLALIDASIKSLFLLILAATACLTLVRASAATRHLVWAATILGLLLMPACALLLPQWRVLPAWLSLENQIDRSETSSLRMDSSNPMIAESLPKNVFTATEQVPADFGPKDFGHSLPTTERTIQVVALAEPIRIRVPASVVLGVWAVGCLLWLLPILIAFLRLRHLERTYRNRHDKPLPPKIADRIKSFASDLGISVPRIILGPAGVMPMVWSIGRSRLFLPSDIVHWSDARINAVLLHELIHLRRRDPLLR